MKSNKKQDKNYEELLKLARQAIESKFSKRELKIDDKIKNKFSEKQACFVTLTENNQLRGCIGSLEPRQELWRDVAENAVHAAFHDHRFYPLREIELNKIKIEISVLSLPEELGIGEEVFDGIDKKMGIILEKGGRSATFLPQVWEQIPVKTEFLEELSLKAGLHKDAWKTAGLSFYRVESVKE